MPPRRPAFGTGGSLIVGARWNATGPETGEVILLQGGGQTRHAWRKTGSRLAADGWFATTTDAREHGESAWHPDADIAMTAISPISCASRTASGRRRC